MLDKDEIVTDLVLTKRLGSNHQQWTYLNLSHIIFTEDSSGEAFEQLIIAIQKNTSLCDVEVSEPYSKDILEKKTWPEEKAQKLGMALKDILSLKSLNIHILENQGIDAWLSFLIALTGKASFISINVCFKANVFKANDQLIMKLGFYLAQNSSLRNIKFQNCGECNEIPIIALEVFISGLCANKSIETLEIDNVKLGDFGFSCLAKHLSPKSRLHQLLLKDTGLGSEGMKSLHNMLENSRLTLTHLTLYERAMTFEGVQILAQLLSSLLHLDILSLFLSLNEDLVAFLVREWRISRLKIRECTLEYTSISQETLALWLDGNTFLQKLILVEKISVHRDQEKRQKLDNDVDTIDSYMLGLVPLFSNPKRCFLKEFRYGKTRNFLDSFVRGAIVSILEKNEFLTIYPHCERERELIYLNNTNDENIFLNECIMLINLCTSPSPFFSKILLQEKLLSKILSFLYENIMEGADMMLTIQLILKNFLKRRELLTSKPDRMEMKPYDPQQPKPDITQWWSLSILTDAGVKTLFCSRKKQPRMMPVEPTTMNPDCAMQ